MKRVVAYCRVSTNQQQNSLDAQQKLIQAQAAVKGMEVDEFIVDEDEFSGDLDRPGVQRVIKLVNSRAVSAVIVTRLDRLTRSTRDAITLIELFAKKGVALVSINENLDTESAVGRFVVRMMASIAELERESIGSRTRDGLQNLKAQGFPAGPAPYGWTAQKRTAEEKQLRIRKPLVENLHEQGILRAMRDLRKDGADLDAIAAELNERGYRTRSGGEWVFQAVARHLKEKGKKK